MPAPGRPARFDGSSRGGAHSPLAAARSSALPTESDEKSGHTRGSTVDLTLIPEGASTSPAWRVGDPLVDCAAPADERFADTSIDMGTGFDCFDPLSATASKQTTAEQATNREILVEAMTDAGFTNLPEEWWHYTLDDEPYPDTYFDTPIS